MTDLSTECSKYDDPFPIIKRRLKTEKYSCTTKDTNKKGILVNSNNCPTKKLIPLMNKQKVCKYDFCAWIDCCDDLVDTCNPDTSKYDTVKIIGDPCIDLHSGLTGNCGVIQQCPELFKNRNISDITICGFNCCTPYICCPNRNRDKSEKGIIVNFIALSLAQKLITFCNF